VAERPAHAEEAVPTAAGETLITALVALAGVWVLAAARRPAHLWAGAALLVYAAVRLST